MDLLIGKENASLWVIRPLAFSFLNIPYIYGGKSPIDGMDCSAIVCELLQAIGLLSTNEELNAQGLYNKFKDNSNESVISIGSLAFYGGSTVDISHVAMFIDTHLIIEAGHGTSDTKSVEDAAKRDAKTRIRPFTYRQDLVAILQPKFEDYGLHD